MKILVCDDHELYREGLKQLLCDHFNDDDIQVFEAVDLKDSFAQASGMDFMLILFDLSMPGSRGVRELSQLKILSDAPIVVISADTNPQTIRKAYTYGAKGYISKCFASKEVLEGVSDVLAGKQSFPRNIRLAHENEENQLSKRQLSVLECLVAGMSNREIADSLYLSEGTVKQYVSCILRFLDVDNRTQAAIKGAEILEHNNQL